MSLQTAAVAYTQARTDRLKGIIDDAQLAEARQAVLDAEKGDFWDKDRGVHPMVPAAEPPSASTWYDRLTEFF